MKKKVNVLCKIIITLYETAFLLHWQEALLKQSGELLEETSSAWSDSSSSCSPTDLIEFSFQLLDSCHALMCGDMC